MKYTATVNRAGNTTMGLLNVIVNANISYPTAAGTTNDTEDNVYTPYGDRPETYIVPVLFAIIFVVGVLGNGTLVVIFLRHRAMRNVPNT